MRSLDRYQSWWANGKRCYDCKRQTEDRTIGFGTLVLQLCKDCREVSLRYTCTVEP